MSMSLGVALATMVGVTPVAAQDESEEPLEPASCHVLTADEVSAAFGEPFALVDGSGADCQFDVATTEELRFLSLFTSVADDVTIEQIVEFLCPSRTPAPGESAAPCGVTVPVGDSTGVYIPEGFGTMLYADLGNGDLFTLQLVGDPAAGIDKQTVLQELAAAALPRVASVPEPEETDEPAEPTFAPDNELEALFPSEIGGAALTVESASGADAFADTELPQAVLDAFAAQGKTLDDVSLATGYVFDPQTLQLVMITAIQVRGADMGAMADTFVSVLNGDGEPPAEQTPGQVSGKDVTIVRPDTDSTDEELQYVYPKDDVLWVVAAVEPALSEVFSKLP